MNGAGALKVMDVSTMMILDTTFVSSTISGKSKMHYFIGRLGNSATNNYVLGLGTGGLQGSVSSSLKQNSAGYLRYYLHEGNWAKNLVSSPNADDLYFYIVINSKTVDEVEIYINSTMPISFNPENELFDATRTFLFRRETSLDSAVVGMELLEFGTLNDELSNLGMTIQQIHDYANASGGLGL